MAASEKRCLYEILGLPRDCTADEIRSAYKKLALQRHPDKLVKSGVSEAEATASFQELVSAYEVLSDPRERAWYDSHRSQILFSGANKAKSSDSVPDLFSFFSTSAFSGYSDTGKGFFKVYREVFDRIYSNELNFANKLGLALGMVKEAPVMGNLESPYAQVTAFYSYWLGFVTVMDFGWVDQYDSMAGPNRKSRRVMEEENKKLRKKARREYNETVRGLAEFVKKRDKRVIDMQVKRNEELERKREEERKKKMELERQKMERARAYEEPEWARAEEDVEIEADNEVDNGKERRDNEFYCVVCGKKFKSEKQWKNHEQSKKHKEKVAELKESFGNTQTENDEGEDEEEDSNDNADGHGFVSADDGADELSERFGASFQFPKRNSNDEEAQSSNEEGFLDMVDGEGSSKGFDDDEATILEAMLSGRKSKKNVNAVHQPKSKASTTTIPGGHDSDEMDFMAYNNLKSTRKNRGARGGRAARHDEEDTTAAYVTEISGQTGENSAPDDGLHEVDTSSHAFMENLNIGKGDQMESTNIGKGEDRSGKTDKHRKQPVDRKSTAKKEENVKSKNSSKGRKQKSTSKASGNVCETCGEDFGSRNKLHIHLGDTGHAALKSR